MEDSVLRQDFIVVMLMRIQTCLQYVVDWLVILKILGMQVMLNLLPLWVDSGSAYNVASI